MHPTTQATFARIGIHGVTDNTTLGELTAKAHALKGGSSRRLKRTKRRKNRTNCRKKNRKILW